MLYMVILYYIHGQIFSSTFNYQIHFKLKNEHRPWSFSFMYYMFVYILSVNEKFPESKFRCFGKYIIQLFGYCCVHVTGQRKSDLERQNSYTTPGTMVSVMHVRKMLFAFFKNLKSSFRRQHARTCPRHFALKTPPKRFRLSH